MIPLKSRALGAASRALHATGVMSVLLAMTGRRAQILIYHRVNDERDPYFGGTPIAVFDRQMAYIAARYRVLGLSELVAGLGSDSLPRNAVAVTLDDGYRDNYINAFPILRRHGIPATIFLATDVIGTDRQLWHDDVFSAFRETKAGSLSGFGTGNIGGPLDTVPARLRVQHRALAYIRTLDEAARTRAIAGLRAALGVGPPGPSPGLMLSWEEVAEMQQAGIRFGSHTATHPILSRCAPDDARREIEESKIAVERRLGVRADGFAYPNGTRADFLDETKRALESAGFGYAVTTIPGTNGPDTDRFELRRGTPWDEDVFAFGMRLLYNGLRF